MALVVENGTGLSNADSYISVADADAYHLLRGNSGWTGDDAVKEIAIRKATEYLGVRYKRRWFGVKKTETQSLDWPRTGVVDENNYELPDDELPVDLVRATAELALRSLQGDVFFADQSTPGSVGSYRVKVGPIEEETEYLGGQSQTKIYPQVTAMLAGITLATNEIRRA